MADLWVCELGLVPYREALSLQESVRAARQADASRTRCSCSSIRPSTRGGGARARRAAVRRGLYASKGIEIVEVDRGGKLTYHGPGQLVGYPIVRLGDRRVPAHDRVGDRRALAGEGIEAHGADERPTGVWVGERKIASMGMHVSRRVSTHGFAINVDNDLEPFTWIVPCGLQGVQMTSVARETGRAGDAAAPRASPTSSPARSGAARAGLARAARGGRRPGRAGR